MTFKDEGFRGCIIELALNANLDANSSLVMYCIPG
jgi:hypothetical protein